MGPAGDGGEGGSAGVGMLVRREVGAGGSEALVVARLAAGGPAERDGRIRVGDVLLGVDG